MEETVAYAKRLAERVGNELQIPVYMYEYAASRPERKNLATIRAGEYEGLPEKLADPNWVPDFGPHGYNSRVAKTGVTVIGARDFLIAYNVNLNTTSTRIANGVSTIWSMQWDLWSDRTIMFIVIRLHSISEKQAESSEKEISIRCWIIEDPNMWFSQDRSRYSVFNKDNITIRVAETRASI